jgi:hypothetical protein
MKNKFGLNTKATCDADCQFLEIWITHPASSSDFLSFIMSDFHKKVQRPGSLAPGLVIFGDNAGMNNSFMAALFKSVKGEGAKDDHEFFQSQVRVEVECSFGTLVHRWATLRGALPAQMGNAKQTSLVCALCKLHNCCIAKEVKRNPHRGTPVTVPASLQTGNLHAANDGGVDIDADGRVACFSKVRSFFEGSRYFESCLLTKSRACNTCPGRKKHVKRTDRMCNACSRLNHFLNPVSPRGH